MDHLVKQRDCQGLLVLNKSIFKISANELSQHNSPPVIYLYFMDLIVSKTPSNTSFCKLYPVI